MTALVRELNLNELAYVSGGSGDEEEIVVEGRKLSGQNSVGGFIPPGVASIGVFLLGNGQGTARDTARQAEEAIDEVVEETAPARRVARDAAIACAAGAAATVVTGAGAGTTCAGAAITTVVTKVLDNNL